MKYATAVVACTAILSAATALAAPHSVTTERSFNDMDIEARAPETGKPDTKPGPRPPVQEDPRLQFTGGRIPGERKKPVKQQDTVVKTEKRSIYDLYLDARENVLSKPVQEQPPVKTTNKRSIDDIYLDARANVLSKPVKEEKPVKTNKRSIDFNLEARANVLSKPVREPPPVKTDKRSIEDFYLDARANVLSKPVKEEKPPVKTNKRSIDDIYLEARGHGTGQPKPQPKPQPQPIVPKPEDDPRLKFIGGKIPGERVKSRSLNDLDLESRQYIENLAEMFERALEEREFIGFDHLD